MYPSRIRLATNSHLLLLRCEREFQLIELLQGAEAEDDYSFSLAEESPILTFGHAWGEGVAEYIATGSLDAAIFKAWTSYYPHLEDEEKGRLEEFCFQGLKVAKDKLDGIREDWEIPTFEGKPARELGFRININKRFYYESAIDAVLQHKREGHLGTLECKHTFHYLDDITPMYKNTSQALVYSIVTDRIAKQLVGQYHLHYFIGQFTKSDGLHLPRIQHHRWKKTLLDRLNFFVALGMDVQRLQMMMDTGIFPMRGHSCLRYNRPCQFFGTCHMRSGDTPKTDEYIEKHKSAHVKEVESRVQFVFELDDIVREHLEAVQKEVGTLKEVGQ